MEATVPFTHRIGLEWCYLLGDFGVRIEGRAGVVTAPVRALSLDVYKRQIQFDGTGQKIMYAAFAKLKKL